MVKYENILKTIESYVEKCSREEPTPTSGIIYPTGEAPRFEPKGKKLTTGELNEIADAMAERYGLEVSEVDGKREINGKKFILWDDVHKTEINLSTLIQRQDEVDFTNRGYYNSQSGGAYESTYTLDEFLSYYNEMPEIMKNATGGVIVKGSGGSYNTFTEGRINNPIVLTHNFLTHTDWYNPKGTDYDLQRVMYHEGGHAMDDTMTPEEYEVMRKSNIGKGRFSPTKLSTPEERDIYNDIMHTSHHPHRFVYSDTSEYDNGMSGNNEKFASDYGRRNFYSSAGQRKRCEDFVETMSMVAMSKTQNSGNAKLDGNDLETFKRNHSDTWKYCEDILDGKVKTGDVSRLTGYGM